MRRDAHGYRSVHILVSLFSASMILYPAEFRRDHGEEMVQVFRTVCLSHVRRGEARGLLRFWFGAMWDSVRSAWREQTETLAMRHGSPQLPLYTGALVASLLAGYVHLRLDADGLSILIVLISAFLCGAVSPSAAWRWGIITGLGIPVALMIGHGFDPTSFPHRDADMPVPAPCIPACIGAYAGVALHRSVTYLRSRTASFPSLFS